MTVGTKKKVKKSRNLDFFMFSLKESKQGTVFIDLLFFFNFLVPVNKIVKMNINFNCLKEMK